MSLSKALLSNNLRSALHRSSTSSTKGSASSPLTPLTGASSSVSASTSSTSSSSSSSSASFSTVSSAASRSLSFRAQSSAPSPSRRLAQFARPNETSALRMLAGSLGYQRLALQHPRFSLRAMGTMTTADPAEVGAEAPVLVPVKHIRNVAIIAHVDHGKTTLVDKLLRECNETINKERVMDSNDLESERGITIFSKCTSVEYRETVVNIVDTPGHADFGGEVERVLDMVDSVVLLVDATEGPMTQTKFVLNKTLKRGLRPVVVLNKVDRETCRIDQVESEIFDLFANLGATEEQLDFTTLYASSREGWTVRNLKADPRNSMKPLLDYIINTVPPPFVPETAPFSMLVTMLGYDKFLGRLLTGRVKSGSVKVGEPVHAISCKGEPVEVGKIIKLTKRRGVVDVELKEAFAGDIVTIAGLGKATVTDTVCDPESKTPIETNPVDPPTVTMTFAVNDSPQCGKSGNKLTSQQIGNRLRQELEHNVSIAVMNNKERNEEFEVQGRGEMQLGVLIENMRREGFELSVSPPRVVIKEIAGSKMEPLEEVIVEVEDKYTGEVIQKLSSRKGDLLDMKPSEAGKTRLYFKVPSRGLLGYRAEFMVDTHGSGVMNRVFDSYIPYKGSMEKSRKGVLVSTETGKSTQYSLLNLEPRGQLFVKPGTEVYMGMIIGEHSRGEDLDVNPVKEKKLTNMRTTEKDDFVRLNPIRQFSLEEALSYIAFDEVVEVTPTTINLRKKYLDPGLRKRLGKKETL